MRIFHLITHFDLGGAERVAANIAASSTEDMEYHMVEIMRGSSAFTPKLLDEFKSHNIWCHRSWIPDIHFHFIFERVAALLFPIRLLYIMLRWHPDVLHVHTEVPDMSVYASCVMLKRLLKRVGIVRTIHNTCLWTGLPRLAVKVERMYIDRHANIAISESVCDSYAKRFGDMPRTIRNGVSRVEQSPWPHLTEGKINVLFAGRFEKQKGISVMCRVIQQLSTDARYHFTIAGDGSLRHYVAQHLGGQENVSIVPPIYSLPSYMSSFDFLFMPSEFEGLGLQSVEASLNGLLVIANRCSGLCDTLPSDWPLFVDGNNVETYVRLFREILPTLNRQPLLTVAYDFVEKRFSLRAMQEAYEKVYRNI